MRSLKICSAVFALLFAMIFAGCGGGGGSSTPTTTTVTTSPNVLVSFSGENLKDQDTLCGGTKVYTNPDNGIGADDQGKRAVFLNNGTADATNCKVSVTLQTGMTYVGPTTLSGVQVSDINGLNLGTIAVNQSVTVDWLVHLSGTLDEGAQLSTTVTIVCDNVLSTSISLITTVGEPSVLCKK